MVSRVENPNIFFFDDIIDPVLDLDSTVSLLHEEHEMVGLIDFIILAHEHMLWGSQFNLKSFDNEVQHRLKAIGKEESVKDNVGFQH